MTEKMDNAIVTFTQNQLRLQEQNVAFYNEPGDKLTGVDLFNRWYPNYYPEYVAAPKDNVSQSFKIMAELMAMGIIKNMTLKDFIATVNKISSIL